MKKKIISMITLGAMCTMLFAGCAARHGALPPPPAPPGAPAPPPPPSK